MQNKKTYVNETRSWREAGISCFLAATVLIVSRRVDRAPQARLEHLHDPIVAAYYDEI
jgi:hypothetical protein